MSIIYFVIDGWMCGVKGIFFVKEMVEGLWNCNFMVVGFWKLFGLFNFKDGKFFDFV